MGLLRKHWQEECLAIQVMCPGCSIPVKRNDIVAHRNEALMNRLLSRISELEYDNEVLKAKEARLKIDLEKQK